MSIIGNKHPIIYTVRLDMSEQVEDEANIWNNTKHISDLMAAGFLSAVRFHSLKGSPKYLHIYELPNLGILISEKYADVRGNDTWVRRLSHGFSNHSASIYEQVLGFNVIHASKMPQSSEYSNTTIGSIVSRNLITVRMNVGRQRADELISWHQKEHIPQMLKVPGFISGRLCRKTINHPRTPSLDPEWMSVYEIESAGNAHHPKIAEVNSTNWALQMHSIVSNVELEVLSRIHPA